MSDSDDDNPLVRRVRPRIAPDEDDNQNDSDGSNPDNYEGDKDEDEEIDGEDLEATWLKDYAAIPELDKYDDEDLASDNGDYAALDYQTRRQIDETLDRRDREERRTRREDMVDDLVGIANQPQARVETFRRYGSAALERGSEEEDDVTPINLESDVNLEAFEVPLREWIAQERTRNEIKKKFKQFLNSYKSTRDTPLVHDAKIKAMCASNSSSLTISYVHLGDMVPILAIWLADVPKDMLAIFDEVLKEVVLDKFPHYQKISSDLHIRITDLPISDKLRDLRQSHINCLVRVCGVVTRRSGVFPALKSVVYDCDFCGTSTSPLSVGSKGGYSVVRPSSCTQCQKNSFKINSNKSEYENYQKINLQESPGSVSPGRVPRYKEVILLGDLIDIARPGEEIEITGIYVYSNLQSANYKSNNIPVFSTVIDANSVVKKDGHTNHDISEEDKRNILKLSKEPKLVDRIIKSMAPSIYGHRHTKTAIALSLFGGCAKQGGSEGTHRVRGDINILMLGDPGTAKSQLLKYVEKIAPRSVYSTGKGASAVGLTAGVHRDPMTKEWVLEGGALVLADQGVCLIDEFDKMNEQDRTSIHEAMEQQTISVSKAGIVTSLQARCAVMAAANPISGRYDPSFTLSENVELTDPILQRFDILCVLQDIVDPVVDEQLGYFVVNSHIRSHPDNQDTLNMADILNHNEDDEMSTMESMNVNDPASGSSVDQYSYDQLKSNYVGVPKKSFYSYEDMIPPPIDQILLKKYIKYSRMYVKPVLREVDSEKIASLYADLRAQSVASGGVPIAVRHIESIIRMSEASARMHLRDHVRPDDVDFAIKIMLESFLQAQKVSVRNILSKSFRKYISYGEENEQLLMHQLQILVRDAETYNQLRHKGKKASTDVSIFMDEFENKAKTLNIFNLRPFYESVLFRTYGFHIDEARRSIVKSF